MTTYYRTVFRPVGHGSLPYGVTWSWAELPANGSVSHRRNIPTSSYYYGVFTTNRPLTRAEMDAFDITIVPNVPEKAGDNFFPSVQGD